MHGTFSVFLFVLHASVFRWNTQAFTYIQSKGNDDLSYRRSGGEPCKLCLAPQDCFRFDPVACEFYKETTKILKKDKEPTDNKSNPKLRADVDSLVYDVIERASSENLIEECIPYISKYTDCSKDNICLGCKTCECNSKGLWNCTVSENCRPDLFDITASKRTLLDIIEVLNKIPAVSRNKRSIYHSIRSLEDMDIEREMNNNNNNEEQSLDIEPVITNTIYEDTRFMNPTTTEKNYKKGNELVKLIVNSLIHDALPDVFKANDFDFENNRVKRWIHDNKTAESNMINNKDTTKIPENERNTQQKITFDEIFEWLNDIHPHFHLKKLRGAVVDGNDSYGTTTPQTDSLSTDKDSISDSNTITSQGINPEYIAFEEVFGSIHFDNKTYIRRKPPLDHASNYYNSETEISVYDERYYDDATRNLTPINADNVVTSDATATTESSLTEDFTKVVVDLLETKIDLSDAKDVFDSSSNKIENLESLNKINAVNIMKRDVLSINGYENTNLTNTNISLTSTAEGMSNNTNNFNISGPKLNYLKNGVLEPLDILLEKKYGEIKELGEIKERLVKFIQSYADQTNLNNNDLKLKKIEDGPNLDRDTQNLRRSNLTLLDKYKIKLKRDVFEVIRDVVAIRKLYNQSMNVPTELNFLIRSLKHYIHKTGFRLKDKVITRRSNTDKSKVFLWPREQSESTIKNIIISIFDLLVKNLRSSDALEFVSPHSRRVIQRLIKKYYVDEFAGTGLRIYDSQYNLTNDLKNIGSQWQIMSLIIKTCPIFDKLYNMKTLHLAIAVDAEKINDALALIKFAKSRRMIPADENEGQIIAMNINKNLNTVSRMIELEFRPLTQRRDINSEEIDLKKHKKKNSFLSQIRRLLKKSKKNIAKLLRKNVSKTDIVKHIARKDVEEMTRRKLQATMEKWQTNLNIIPRVKRSNENHEKINRRIANILPKYLRGKVNPGITKGENAKKEYNKLKKKGMVKKKNSTIEYKKKPYLPKSKSQKEKNLTVTTKHPAKISNHLREKMHSRIKSKKVYAAHEKTQHVKTSAKHTKKYRNAKHATTKALKPNRNTTNSTTFSGSEIPTAKLKHNTQVIISKRRTVNKNSTRIPAFKKHISTSKNKREPLMSNRKANNTDATRTFNSKIDTKNLISNRNTLKPYVIKKYKKKSFMSNRKVLNAYSTHKVTSQINTKNLTSNRHTVKTHAIRKPASTKHTTTSKTNIKAHLTKNKTFNTNTEAPAFVKHTATSRTNAIDRISNRNTLKTDETKVPSYIKHSTTITTKVPVTNKNTAEIGTTSMPILVEHTSTTNTVSNTNTVKTESTNIPPTAISKTPSTEGSISNSTSPTKNTNS